MITIYWYFFLIFQYNSNVNWLFLLLVSFSINSLQHKFIEFAVLIILPVITYFCYSLLIFLLAVKEDDAELFNVWKEVKKTAATTVCLATNQSKSQVILFSITLVTILLITCLQIVE